MASLRWRLRQIFSFIEKIDLNSLHYAELVLPAGYIMTTWSRKNPRNFFDPAGPKIAIVQTASRPFVAL
jgi:hypothetical protein